MQNVLEVKNLCKTYPKFKLNNVSFSVPEGAIMGFIGRNGAGKSTTLKSILKLVHPDSGEIRFFGMELEAHESEIKQAIGFAGGAVDYYKKKKISDIVDITRRFYETWDDEAYKKYSRLFELDDSKKPSELSEGMKVKLNITLALSHGARLLILDEPTSGLDPVSRDELLEVFEYLSGKGISILFSTHITSDLDKCADYITYIKKGEIVASEKKSDFMQRCRDTGIGSTIEEIMIHYEKRSIYENTAD